MMKILNKFDDILFFIAKASIVICMFLITINAAGRYIFNKPITGAYEFVELYLMVTIVFMSLSYTWRHRGFISINIFSSKFPIIIQNIIYFIILILGIAFFSLIGYEAYLNTAEAFVKNQVASGLIPWPLYLSTIWIPLGCLMINLRMLLELIVGIKNLMDKGMHADIFSQMPHTKSDYEQNITS